MGGLVLLLLIVGGIGTGVAIHLHNEAEKEASAEASATPEYSSDPYSYSPPAPTARDAYTLDDESSDETPFELKQFFPDTLGGYSYELAAAGFYSACSDAGGSDTAALLRKHDCGNMATASYLDRDNELLASVMVIPLPSDSDASAVQKAFDGRSAAFNELSYFCPRSGSASKVCDGDAPTWQGFYIGYHRYMLVTVVLRWDGGTSGGGSAVKAIGNATINGVEEAMLVIRDSSSPSD
ncbi:MAG: hypothetical protein WCA46_00060 [Actinocatenispora sp.]